MNPTQPCSLSLQLWEIKETRINKCSWLKVQKRNWNGGSAMLSLGHLLTCSSVPQAPLCYHIYKHTLWPFVICDRRVHSIQLEQPHSLLAYPPHLPLWIFKATQTMAANESGGTHYKFKITRAVFMKKSYWSGKSKTGKLARVSAFWGVDDYAQLHWMCSFWILAFFFFFWHIRYISKIQMLSELFSFAWF